MENNNINFIDLGIKHWKIVVIFATLVATWTHFQTNQSDFTKQLSEFQIRIANVETATQTASVNYATLSGKIDTTNAKIDILLKHDSLQ